MVGTGVPLPTDGPSDGLLLALGNFESANLVLKRFSHIEDNANSRDFVLARRHRESHEIFGFGKKNVNVYASLTENCPSRTGQK